MAYFKSVSRRARMYAETAGQFLQVTFGGFGLLTLGTLLSGGLALVLEKLLASDYSDERAIELEIDETILLGLCAMLISAGLFVISSLLRRAAGHRTLRHSPSTFLLQSRACKDALPAKAERSEANRDGVETAARSAWLFDAHEPPSPNTP